MTATTFGNGTKAAAAAKQFAAELHDRGVWATQRQDMNFVWHVDHDEI